ncbi:MAG: hypothetical protein IT388_04745 [Nitrospirales bacterium]|nr:hypothetical protein [Nitrospirales bacterium]
MKILHLLNDGPTPLSDAVMQAQSERHELQVIDLSRRENPAGGRKEKPYESIVDAIFSCDRVISW